MKTVKVFGPGCKRCEATETMVKDTAAKLGLDVTVEKVTDAKSIAMAGVMSTPGIAVRWQAGSCRRAAGCGKAGRMAWSVIAPSACVAPTGRAQVAQAPVFQQSDGFLVDPR